MTCWKPLDSHCHSSQPFVVRVLLFSISRIHCRSLKTIGLVWICRYRPAMIVAFETKPSGSPAVKAFCWVRYPWTEWNLHCYCFGWRWLPSPNRYHLDRPLFGSLRKMSVEIVDLVSDSVTEADFPPSRGTPEWRRWHRVVCYYCYWLVLTEFEALDWKSTRAVC